MAVFNYSQQFWQRIAQEEQARLDDYKQAWNFYDGKQPMPLAVKTGRPNDNVILNLYAYIVDKGVSFLFGKDLELQLEEGTETEAEQFLKTTLTRNKKMLLLQSLALNGGNCGHCFVEIAPRENDVPRLINLDPAIVRPFWDPDDIDKVLWYKIEYEALGTDGKPVLKKRLIELDEDSARWVISSYEKRAPNNVYVLVSEVFWNFPFAPIVDWQNLPAPNVYFGKRDIEQVSPQNGINFVASNMQKIIRLHAHPKTVGKGFAAQNVNVGPDEMILLPSENADVKNLEMQSDLTATRAYFDMLIDLFLQLHHTPNMNPTKVSLGALSGFALKILYGDLLALTGKKQLTYGQGIAEIVRRLLIVGGYKEQTPSLHWASPLPENNAEATDTAIKQMDAGIASKETTRAALGFDNETEAARIEAEALNANSIGSELLRAFNRGGGTQ